MEGLPACVTGQAVSESYLNCVRSFTEFLLALSEEHCAIIYLGQVQLLDVSEEYGRIKIWGDQVKADLPLRARGSLDDVLRHDVDLKSLVHSILTRLRVLLEQATLIAKRKYDINTGADLDSISSVSADSDLDSDETGEPQSRRMPKIRLLVEQMKEQIKTLYDLSALLRRPSITNKYIRSSNSKPRATVLSGLETLSLNSGLNSSDECHVAEKIRQWRGLTKSTRGVEFLDEDAAAAVAVDVADKRRIRESIHDIMWFCQRLARANTRRREQLRYWADHPYNPDAAQVQIPHLTKLPAKSTEKEAESRNHENIPKPTDFTVPCEGPKSTLSKQSFSTAAVSDLYDTHTNIRPRTVYAPTAMGQIRSNSIPDPPKTENGKKTFFCPYCGTSLDAIEMQNRQSWKRHVFRDLRPYVCTFENCQSDEKLYITRHEWIYHELQIHRREYLCKECHKVCSSRKQLSTHLREHYDESVTQVHLSLILDLCSQQVDTSGDRKDSCIVCGEELPLSVLQGHLAVHMEDIALFVLPTVDEDEEANGSNASLQVAKLNSKDNFSNPDSEASSLNFSAAEDDGKIPIVLSKLPSSEEAGFTSKCSTWKMEENIMSTYTRSQIHGKTSEKVVSNMQESEETKNTPMQFDKKKVDIESKEYEDQTSLSRVATERPESIIQLPPDTEMINVESKEYEGRQPLSWAAKNGHEAIVRLLLDTGSVDVDPKDNEGRTPLSLAAESGHEAIVKLLLNTRRVDVDSQDHISRTPLSWAAENGHEAIVKLLLDTGKVDVDLKDYHSRTPLLWAAYKGQEAIVKLLLGPENVNVELNENEGRRPLPRATESGHEAIVKLLLDMGKIDIDSKDTLGRTPLSWATINRHEGIVKLLLDMGKVDIDSTDYGGWTPLSWAAENGHEGIVKLLLDTGKVDVNTKDSRARTPLSWAAENGHEAIVKLLLDTGKVDVDAKDSRARTPLSWAAKNGHEIIVKLLLETGKANADSKDYGGWTPLSWAAENGHEAIVKKLEDQTLRKGGPSTVDDMKGLAAKYRARNQWAEAEKLEVQIMEIIKEKLGTDHPDTLTSMANLALTYLAQGKWDAAEELEVQVIELQKELMGEGHPETLFSMAKLVSIYKRQSRWQAAEELCLKVLEARKEVLGMSHAHTMDSMASLASIYERQGHLDAAEELLLQVIEARKNELGMAHSETLAGISNLAFIYNNQGRWEAAEKLWVQVIESRKVLLGPENPDTLTSMANLATTYRHQGRWDAAEELEVQVMEARKMVLGLDHLDTLNSMAKLASTYRKQDRYDAAEPLEVQVMENSKKTLGTDHPFTISSMTTLALTYRNQGRLDAAEPLEEQVMESSKRIFGPDHDYTITSMTSLALTYREQGRLEAALDLEGQVMKALRETPQTERHSQVEVSA